MKVIQFEEYGTSDVLKIQEIDKPQPNADEILIQIKAFTVNPLDWKLRQGVMKAFFPLQFPHILGSEFAGVVAEVGRNVTRFKVGDRVYGRGSKTYAEYAVTKEDLLQIIPPFLDFNQAASLPSGTFTAYSALKSIGNIQPNQDVLIHAGAGGVGLTAIQIAKNFAANVTTTVSENNFDLVKKLGADHVIDYNKTDFSQIPEKFDLILDSIGGKTQIASWELLKSNGTLVSLVGDEQKSFISPAGEKTFTFMRGVVGNPFPEIHTLISDRKIIPVIDQVFDFDDIASAHNKSATGHASGKIVIKISD